MVGGAWKSVQVNNSQSLDCRRPAQVYLWPRQLSADRRYREYGEASWNKQASLGWTGVQSNQGNVTIMSDNAYIPASVKSQLTA